MSANCFLNTTFLIANGRNNLPCFQLQVLTVRILVISKCQVCLFYVFISVECNNKSACASYNWIPYLVLCCHFYISRLHFTRRLKFEKTRAGIAENGEKLRQNKNVRPKQKLKSLNYLLSFFHYIKFDPLYSE